MKYVTHISTGFLLLCAFCLSSCGPPVTNIDVGCSASELIDAINTANDSPTTPTTLHLSPECVYELTDILTYDTEIYPVGVALPEIISPITIDGQAATIRRSDAPGTPAFRLFLVNSAADLTIDNIYLKNGNIIAENGKGGAILNYGTLTITLSDVFNNKAGRGGAIYNTGTFSTLWSVYYNNEAHAMGGMIQSNGDMTLDRSIFYENIAYWGGAVANHTGTGEVTGCHFTNNQSSDNGFGGAISNSSSHTGDIGKMHVYNSTFNENLAGHGGAIANMNFSEIMFQETTFDGNIAQYGGAGYNQEEMVLTRCTLSNNSANFYGGAIFFHDNDDSMGMPVGNTTFSGNHITDGTINAGSAIYQSNGGLGMHFVTITENNGAIAVVKTGGSTTITDSIIANNPDGNCGGSDINSIDVLGNANIDNDGTCPYFTITADPLLYPLADNGGDTLTHALQNGSPAIDAATEADMTIDQRLEPRPAGAASDIGAFELQDTSIGPQTITVIPQIISMVPMPEEPHKIPDYYWEFEGFVCSDIGLTEFFMRTSAPMENFRLQLNEKSVACFQQSYDKERYWCHVEKRSIGWNVPAEITFCEEELCTTINRTTLAESRCDKPDAPSEPEPLDCQTFTTNDDCSAAPGCIWNCDLSAVAKLCACVEKDK